jgi:hypothetical protein
VGKIKKLTKTECLDIFEQVLWCIKAQKRGFFTFKKLRGVHGYCEWEDGIILDYRKDLIPTIIHECLHLMNESWSEAQVAYTERRIVNTITEDHVIRLLMFFVKKI